MAHRALIQLQGTYLLLQHVIEQFTGRTVVKVMRDGGVLNIDGIERLVYQPDERPTAPMALPDAMSPAEWKKGRGYLPSIAKRDAGPDHGISREGLVVAGALVASLLRR